MVQPMIADSKNFLRIICALLCHEKGIVNDAIKLMIR